MGGPRRFPLRVQPRVCKRPRAPGAALPAPGSDFLRQVRGSWCGSVPWKPPTASSTALNVSLGDGRGLAKDRVVTGSGGPSHSAPRGRRRLRWPGTQLLGAWEQKLVSHGPLADSVSRPRARQARGWVPPSGDGGACAVGVHTAAPDSATATRRENVGGASPAVACSARPGHGHVGFHVREKPGWPARPPVAPAPRRLTSLSQRVRGPCKLGDSAEPPSLCASSVWLA